MDYDNSRTTTRRNKTTKEKKQKIEKRQYQISCHNHYIPDHYDL